MGCEADGATFWMFIHGHLMTARIHEPVDDVAAPVTTRQASCFAHAKMHLTARAVQIFHHLTTRLTTANHQDRAVRQLCGVSIVAGVQPQDVVGKLVAPCRYVRVLMGADGDDHIVRHELALGCFQGESPFVARRCDPMHLHTPSIRWLEALGEALDVRDNFVAEHKALGLVPVVRKSR